MDQSLSEADNGRAIELHVQESLQIQLPESRMGGYRWSLVEAGEPVLAAIEMGTKAASSLPGQANIRRWQFSAKQQGSVQIQLRHRRSWEPESSGSEFSLSVKVVA